MTLKLTEKGVARVTELALAALFALQPGSFGRCG